MILTDQDPRWVTLAGWASPSRFSIGLTFRCPHCQDRLAVLFTPVIDPDGLVAVTGFDIHQYAAWNGQPVWERTGDAFETLTLTPSIDASQSGHWHGFITNGEIR